MKRRLIIAGMVLVTLAIPFCLYWYGGTPRVGRRFQLRKGNVTSFEVLIQNDSIESVTNAVVSTKLAELIRSARSVEPHACKNRGTIILHYADGDSSTVPFLPGHNWFRYEFSVPGGPYAVSRSSFMSLMKSAGMDTARIPRD